MKAIGYKKAGPITNEASLEDIEVPTPELRPRDVLVQVKGISVNPVDSKIRTNISPESGYKIIGYDACGTIIDKGPDVTDYDIGDDVFYAGDLSRPGTNSEFHAVDERIIGHKPKSLDFEEAAAIPLTAITAWELLFESLRLKENGEAGKTLLVLGGAGGVGSILIQLAKKLTKLTVIATASRPQTSEWVTRMGADHIIDHTKPLTPQLAALSCTPDYIASLRGTDQHFEDMVSLIAPRGHIALIDDPQGININLAKQKALSISWEFMFTRPMFDMADMYKQQELLNRVSVMLDDGLLQSTMTGRLGTLDADSLKKAHTIQETGKVIGKNVMAGLGA
ncbi:MAG: zinc-binding alcohol dehydrogenase family protein [Candidatus Puniceispirillaceae bacterium]